MPTKTPIPLLKLMRERQSVRMPYDADHAISNEDLVQILEAARWTPTAHNMQNFEIVVVDDKDVLNAIGEIPTHSINDFHSRKLSLAFVFRRRIKTTESRNYGRSVSTRVERPR